jgi:peptide/nickel transport system ATP-binding protein
MPSGCAFHPRCPHAFDRCSTEIPILGTPEARKDPNREVACWLPGRVPVA